MARVMIFIDANNFRQHLNDYFGKDKAIIDVAKLVRLLAEGRNVVKTYYYINQFKQFPSDPKKNANYVRQQQFFTVIEGKIPNFKVKPFEMQKRKGGSGFQEKGVDQEITMDMLDECNNYDIAVLVSEDKDFVNLVKRLINEKGKRVEMVVPFFGKGHHLRQVCSRKRILSVKQLESILMTPPKKK